MNLLKENNNDAFNKYKSKIKIHSEDLFENNGLYITGCQYFGNIISVTFSDKFKRNQYVNRYRNRTDQLSPISGKIKVTWKSGKNVLNSVVVEKELDYEQVTTIKYTNVPKIEYATAIEIKYYFDDNLMCFVKQPLEIHEAF